MKNMMVPCTPVIVWSWSIHCPSLSAMFDSLHSSTNQEVFEKHLYNKSSHYEKYGRFLVTQRKPSHATTKLMLFTVSKDERNTKEDTGKSLKNALHVLRCAKRHLLGLWHAVSNKNQINSWRRESSSRHHKKTSHDVATFFSWHCHFLFMMLPLFSRCRHFLIFQSSSRSLYTTDCGITRYETLVQWLTLRWLTLWWMKM